MKPFLFCLILLLSLVGLSHLTHAQTPSRPYPRTIEQRLAEQEIQIKSLQSNANRAATTGGLAFLFGAFCALWAQNTGRSPWLWFVCGAFFTIVAVIIVLVKNAGPRVTSRPRSNFNL